MIVLTQNIINQVTATLQEKQLTSTNTFLLELVNDTSMQAVYSVLVDQSEDPLSYNTFYLSANTGSANPLLGEITVSLPGFYEYSFFEGTGSINPTSSIGLNIVETGKALVLPSVTASNPAFTSSYNPNPVFNPQDYAN